MPSGKTHLRIEAVLLAVWTVGLGFLVSNDQIAYVQGILFGGSYIFSMLFMSPDLDLAQSDAFHRWGIFRWMWLPYAWVFRHRQTSHHLFWGPLTRVVYVGIFALGAGLAVRFGYPNAAVGSHLSAQSVLAVSTGLYLPNLEHIVADRLITRYRHNRRRRRL